MFTNIRKQQENLQNEDSEILFVVKSIECQFHKTRTFVFFRRPYRMLPLSGAQIGPGPGGPVPPNI